MNNLKPFVGWAGGKTQLLPVINELKPKKFNTYIEPFLGGGSVLFNLQPKKAIVGDLNKELIHTYNMIKNFPNEFLFELNKLDNSEQNKELYYKVREMFNDKISNKLYDVEMAAYFVYLNKHCFNCLYRVNKKGFFNVPYNNKKSIRSCEPENILNVSQFLKGVNMLHSDFKEVTKYAEQGDFVFIDSPYVDLDSKKVFTSYTKYSFLEEDHVRLAEEVERLNNKGCYIMLTNHNTDYIKKLYENYNFKIVSARRSINCKGTDRSGEEIIITNY